MTYSVQKLCAEEMLQIIRRNGTQTTFPGVFVALRPFLTLPVTNCEGERSFSQLKRIKNELKTMMGLKCLSALSLIFELNLNW